MVVSSAECAGGRRGKRIRESTIDNRTGRQGAMTPTKVRSGGRTPYDIRNVHTWHASEPDLLSSRGAKPRNTVCGRASV